MTAVERYDPSAAIEPIPARRTVATPMEMIQTALANGQSMEVIEKLMALHERWEASQGRKAFDAAISDAKAELPAIIKNQTANRGNAGSYKYEDLAQIASQVDPVLGRHGLSYRFRTECDNGKVKVTCIVSHRDGYSETTALECGADTSGAKNAIQAMGSAVTYLQRYTLKAALGLAASKDDDAKVSDMTGITAEQFQSLRGLLEKSGADEGRFLKHFGVEGLHEMPAAKYAAADAMLRQKLAKAEAGNEGR